MRGLVLDNSRLTNVDGSTYDDNDLCVSAMGNLIAHAENEHYRIAVVDGPQNSSMSEIRHFRGKFDSKYAALYHPWIEIFDPLQRPAQGAPPRRITLPPSGFVKVPSSKTPAFNHLPIRRDNTPSHTRRRRNSRKWA